MSFDPQCCNTAQLNVDITTNSSSATTPVVLPVDSTDPTNTTIVITDITEGVCYTASIWSVCRDANNLLEDSGVLVVNFMTYGECVHPCVHISVCACRCVYACTCMCICMCGGVHTAYICTYTFNIVLVIACEVPLQVLLEMYILVLSTKVTYM